MYGFNLNLSCNISCFFKLAVWNLYSGKEFKNLQMFIVIVPVVCYIYKVYIVGYLSDLINSFFTHTFMVYKISVHPDSS